MYLDGTPRLKCNKCNKYFIDTIASLMLLEAHIVIFHGVIGDNVGDFMDFGS